MPREATTAKSVPKRSQARCTVLGVTAVQPREVKRPSGHVFRVEGARGAVWFAKYRLPNGRQIKIRLGPASPERGRPPAGYFTKHTAEDWLRDTLDEARRRGAPSLLATGVTFADAAAEFLRYAEHDRGCKPSTLRDYRSRLNAHLLPAFGSRRVDEVTTRDIERWRAAMVGSRGVPLTNKSKNNLVVLLHGIFRRAMSVYELAANPVAMVERQRIRSAGDIEVFEPQEVWALARAASSEQDRAIYLTAAFTGLRRGELLALQWRDVDFVSQAIRVRGNWAAGQLTTPKSGKVRSVPLAPDVARVLAQLGERPNHTSEDDLVFAAVAGGHLDGDALSSRYRAALKRANLRPLRFHDLRHTFGTRMIAKADVRRVQEWMGHADIQTTMKYLHYAPRAGDAALVAEAFALEDAPARPDVIPAR
jgi:integrase